MRVLGAFRSQLVGDGDLHVVHHVKVEEAVEEANPAAEVAIRDPAIGPGMMRLKMLDDRRGFEDRLIVVDQHWELTERRMPPQYLAVLRMIGAELSIVERRLVRPKSDEDLLRVAAERMAE